MNPPENVVAPFSSDITQVRLARCQLASLVVPVCAILHLYLFETQTKYNHTVQQIDDMKNGRFLIEDLTHGPVRMT